MTRPSTGVTLRGRDRELAAVAGLLQAAADGRGGALAVVGDVGSGKSTLLAAAAALVPGATVLHAAGWPSETGLAFAGLHRMLRPAAGGEVSLPPTRTRELVRDLETRRFDATQRVATALAALLRAGARQHLVLCCVDDVRWLDRPSRDVLAAVAGRTAGLPIAMLFADRDPPGELMAGVEQVSLSPLDQTACRELLADVSPAPLAGDVAGVLATVAGGNPLALVELAASLSPEQRRGDAHPPLTLPPESRLRREHEARLAALPDDTRRLLLLLAADRDLGLDGLGRAAVGARLEIDALGPARRADIVRVRDAAVAFTEPVVASLVYDAATLAERRAAHRVLADSLDPVRHRLRHLVHRAAVATGRDPALAAELAAAAQSEERAQASRGPASRGLASRALERAAELTDDPARAGAYLVRAARHAWEGGEPHRARMMLRRLRPADLPAHVNAQAELLRGEIELRAGGTNHARQTLLSAASELERDPELAVTAIMRAGEATLQSGAYAHYPNLAEKALALRGDSESKSNDLQLEHLAGATAVFTGQFEAARAPLRRVLALAAEIDDATALTRACVAAKLLGDEHEALRLAIRAAALARAAGDMSSVPVALDLAASAECALGRVDSATDTLLEALPLARATGQTSLASSLLAMLGYTAAILGDRATCLARLREARIQASSHGAVRPEAVIEYTLGVLDLVSGRPAEALVRMRRLRGGGGQGQLAIATGVTPKLVEAAVRSGDRDRALRIFARFEPWAIFTDQPLWLGKAARCRALLAEDEAVAEHEYRQALKYHTLDECDFERAQTELLFGQVLRRRRRPSEAREHLRWSLEAFQRLDARRWIELAAGELRATGDQSDDLRAVATNALTPQQLQIARLAAGGATATESLTPQQLQIARMAAAGATNREVAALMSLSPRTVDHHMRNIFARLGIHSRIELGRIIPSA